MNVHQGESANLAACMRRVEACPSCGGRESFPAFSDNDITRHDHLPEALRRSDYVICADCALVYASWRQTEDAASHYYSLFPELEHRTYGTYPPPERYRRQKQVAARRIVGACRDAGLLRDGASVLHIRSDCGSIGPAIREVADGCTVAGCDYFDSNIRWANETGALEAYRLEPTGVAPPAPGRRFDLIVANHVLTHALDPQRDLDRLAAMLAPGGRIYVYNEVDSLLYFTLGYRTFKTRPVNNYHKQLYSPETLVRSFRARGFVASRVARRSNRLSCVLTFDPEAARTPSAPREEVERVRSAIGRWNAVRRSVLSPLFALPALRAVYKLGARRPSADPLAGSSAPAAAADHGE